MPTLTPTPPGMMRMASGKLVPMSKPFGTSKIKVKRFLIVIQFYEGDRDAAEQLALLIADLERTRNHEADIMLMRRADCRPLNPQINAKLGMKFDKVLEHTCRRTDAKNYPFASNQMFADLVMLMAQMPNRDDYFAFINFETDVTPIHPGWIGEIIRGWQNASADGFLAMGHINEQPDPAKGPVRHLNGVAVYSTELWQKVGRNKLAGANPQIAYDIYHAEDILPVAKDTPLIAFHFRQPTITPTELFAPHKGGVEPSLYHGVKDGSARAAVRARYISFTERKVPMAPAVKARTIAPEPPKDRPPVYTYTSKFSGINAAELAAILEAWKKGWSSRGWNPIILGLRQASEHLAFDEFQAAIDRLPFVGNKQDTLNRFTRWLALDVMGGGLMTDIDILPGAFTPEDIIRKDVGLVLSPKESPTITAALFDQPSIAKFINVIKSYDARPEDMVDGKPAVTDMMIWRATNPDAIEPTVGNADQSPEFKLQRFSAAGTTRASTAMDKFLKDV